MSEIAISAEKLSKRYRLGPRLRYKALRDVLAESLRMPYRVLSPFLARSNHVLPSERREEEYFWALRDVSFKVGHGESVGIIGRNGAGKSTLLKILSRITSPTRGKAEINGRVGSLLEVGAGFHPELTGRENIFLNGAILGMKRHEIFRRFDKIVEFAEVEEFLDTPVKHYSSGMFVRLAFSVAAHLEPEVLLIDEVLAVGDAAFQKKCLGKMGDIAREGRTILFVSHNMAAVRSLCTRSILISKGGVCFSGPTDQCIDRYLLAASDDMPARVDTSSLRRPSVIAHDESLRITFIELEAPTGRAILQSGRPIDLRFQLHLTVVVDEFLLAWSFHSADTVRLFECRSFDTFGLIERLSPGCYSMTCRVAHNPLNPGLYTLHAGARCAEKGLDYLPEVMTVRVESSEQYESLWLESPSGIFRVSSEWTAPEPIVNAQRDL
jgi:lipopolysaccharide transport system ATP-binding protein